MECECHASKTVGTIQEQIGPTADQNSRLAELEGLWPKLTIRALLYFLRSVSSIELRSSWRNCLLALGEAITMQQRARRLVLAAEREDLTSFSNEAENEGHYGWDMARWPDWLLLEVENDFLIRPIQARVALEMIQPASSKNSLLQLNMGKQLNPIWP